MKSIAFIGLGNMGFPIAKNLLDAGYKLKAYNRSVEKRTAFAALGGSVVDTVAEAVREAEFIVTMLSDDNAAEDVCTKIFSAAKSGAIHISMSTLAPANALKLSALHQQHSLIYLSSPVMGRPPAAAAKQLFILLSGHAAAKEKAQPILQALSQRIFDYGTDASAANTVKLIMNYMIFATAEMLSETMLISEKAGLNKQALLETMTSTIFGSSVFKIYGNLIAEEKDIPNGFSTQLASKDLRLFQETADFYKMKLPVADIIQSNFKEMISEGNGQKDVSMLISQLRESLKKEN